MLKYSLGLDVSKSSFHACISTIDAKQAVKVQRSGTFSNNEKGFTELQSWISREHRDSSLPLVITLEATGIYHERLALYLHQNGYAISIILPNKAKKYIASLGIKTKNDTADARALSRMGAEQSLELWEPMGEFFYTLRSMTRQYQRLQQIKTMLTNQKEAIGHGAFQIEAVKESNKAMLAMIEEQLKAMQKAISSHLSSDKAVARKTGHITAITGVAKLTVAVILAETNGFALFTNSRQLVSFCGYDVVENQSGKHQGKTKISKKGNSRIRRILHMPALNVVRWNVKVFRDLFERVHLRTGIKMKGYVAVQKKLLTTIYALWKNDVRFDVDYWQRNQAKTTSDGEAVYSSRQSSSAVHQSAAKKLAPRKGGAKQGIQPSDGVGVCILSA
jgi:transposase